MNFLSSMALDKVIVYGTTEMLLKKWKPAFRALVTDLYLKLLRIASHARRKVRAPEVQRALEFAMSLYKVSLCRIWVELAQRTNKDASGYLLSTSFVDPIALQFSYSVFHQ